MRIKRVRGEGAEHVLEIRAEESAGAVVVRLDVGRSSVEARIDSSEWGAAPDMFEEGLAGEAQRLEVVAQNVQENTTGCRGSARPA